ncbi:hypothetical protein [Cupriavidus basilensis]|uniref:Uncharacterized protein n=1 Tax=Cupriavidus basilensis TaxID=68895 RepID=A0A643FIN5_9BURK|nr:hypothetical protein [Cupriavidus basilensis]QOT76342.1 hypothetical protein F7R26_019805 [Cupriavidus basilensis]
MLSLDVERALAALTSKLLHEPIPGFKPHRAEHDARQFALSAAGLTADITLREAQAKLLATATRLDAAAETALHRLEAFSTPTPAALAEFHIAARRARAAWNMYYQLPVVDSK